MRIWINIKPTIDFLQGILSMSEDIEAIAPLSFREKMKIYSKKMIVKYD